MPLSFDLSGVNSSSNTAQRRTSGSVLTPMLLQPLEPKFSKPIHAIQAQPLEPFTFSFAPPASTFKTTFMNALDIKAEADQCQEIDRADDPENDQYTVAPEKSLCFAVFCKHETGRRHPRSVLGDHGHLERSSAWIHLLGGLAFVIYTGLRQLMERPNTVANSLVTAACGATGLAFLCSTVYHVTAPSKQWAYWTRLLDYFGAQEQSNHVFCFSTISHCQTLTREQESILR